MSNDESIIARVDDVEPNINGRLPVGVERGDKSEGGGPRYTPLNEDMEGREVEKRRVEKEGRNAVVRVRRVIVNIVRVDARGYVIIGEVSGGFFFGNVEGEGERSGGLEEGEGGGRTGR